MCFKNVTVFQQAVLSHRVVTAGRASRLSPPHRKALIPLRCSKPVQHLSYPHFEPPPVSALPRVQGFPAAIVGLYWFPVVFCSCSPKSPSSLNCPILLWEPSSSAVTTRQVPVAQWYMGSVSCPGNLLSHFVLLHLPSLSVLHSW